MYKKNIVIFMMDQLSAKWLEAGREGACRMPNFNRLMDNGTTFDCTVTNNPVCMPARSTIATGLSCRAHGVTENGIELDPNIPTFMQILQTSGWRTGNFGKLHYKAHFNGPYHDYKPYGFDEVYEVADMRAGDWLDWVEENYPEYYEKALSIVWPIKACAGLEKYGKKGVDLIQLVAKAQKENPRINPVFEGKPVYSVFKAPLPEEVTPTGWITRNGLDFIKKNAGKQPFLAHMSYILPHDPFSPPENYLGEVNPDKIPHPVPDTWKQEEYPKHFDFDRTYQGIAGYWKIYREYYFACITFLDTQLGRIFQTLEDSGELDNTYIILLADHGELLYDHGFVSKHNRHYDACIRVPLIISGPGLQKGVHCNKPVQLEDIMPTILELTKCDAPKPRILPGYIVSEEYPPMFSGKSLVPFCKGEYTGKWREYAYAESFSYWRNVQPVHWAFTLRNERYRYTFYPCGGGEQLFDLFADKDETKNVVKRKEYANIRINMRDELLERVILQDSPKSQVKRLFYHEHP
jgi:arylsulfatase A-like enzyme